MKITERLREYAKAYREPPTGREVEGTVELLEEAAEHIEMLGGKEERDIVFRRCICDYGTQPQVDMMIEEMSELTKAVCKLARANIGAEAELAVASIREEMADVQIMLDQMKVMFGDPVDQERKKIARLRRRLETAHGRSEQA